MHNGEVPKGQETQSRWRRISDRFNPKHILPSRRWKITSRPAGNYTKARIGYPVDFAEETVHRAALPDLRSQDNGRVTQGPTNPNQIPTAPSVTKDAHLAVTDYRNTGPMASGAGKDYDLVVSSLLRPETASPSPGLVKKTVDAFRRFSLAPPDLDKLEREYQIRTGANLWWGYLRETHAIVHELQNHGINIHQIQPIDSMMENTPGGKTQNNPEAASYKVEWGTGLKYHHLSEAFARLDTGDTKDPFLEDAILSGKLIVDTVAWSAGEGKLSKVALTMATITDVLIQHACVSGNNILARYLFNKIDTKKKWQMLSLAYGHMQLDADLIATWGVELEFGEGREQTLHDPKIQTERLLAHTQGWLYQYAISTDEGQKQVYLELALAASESLKEWVWIHGRNGDKLPLNVKEMIDISTRLSKSFGHAGLFEQAEETDPEMVTTLIVDESKVLNQRRHLIYNALAGKLTLRNRVQLGNESDRFGDIVEYINANAQGLKTEIPTILPGTMNSQILIQLYAPTIFHALSLIANSNTDKIRCAIAAQDYDVAQAIYYSTRRRRLVHNFELALEMSASFAEIKSHQSSADIELRELYAQMEPFERMAKILSTQRPLLVTGDYSSGLDTLYDEVLEIANPAVALLAEAKLANYYRLFRTNSHYENMLNQLILHHWLIFERRGRYSEIENFPKALAESGYTFIPSWRSDAGGYIGFEPVVETHIQRQPSGFVSRIIIDKLTDAEKLLYIKAAKQLNQLLGVERYKQEMFKTFDRPHEHGPEQHVEVLCITWDGTGSGDELNQAMNWLLTHSTDRLPVNTVKTYQLIDLLGPYIYQDEIAASKPRDSDSTTVPAGIDTINEDAVEALRAEATAQDIETAIMASSDVLIKSLQNHAQAYGITLTVERIAQLLDVKNWLTKSQMYAHNGMVVYETEHYTGGEKRALISSSDTRTPPVHSLQTELFFSPDSIQGLQNYFLLVESGVIKDPPTTFYILLRNPEIIAAAEIFGFHNEGSFSESEIYAISFSDLGQIVFAKETQQKVELLEQITSLHAAKANPSDSSPTGSKDPASMGQSDSSWDPEASEPESQVVPDNAEPSSSQPEPTQMVNQTPAASPAHETEYPERPAPEFQEVERYGRENHDHPANQADQVQSPMRDHVESDRQDNGTSVGDTTLTGVPAKPSLPDPAQRPEQATTPAPDPGSDDTNRLTPDQQSDPARASQQRDPAERLNEIEPQRIFTAEPIDTVPSGVGTPVGATPMEQDTDLRTGQKGASPALPPSGEEREPTEREEVIPVIPDNGSQEETLPAENNPAHQHAVPTQRSGQTFAAPVPEREDPVHQEARPQDGAHPMIQDPQDPAEKLENLARDRITPEYTADDVPQMRDRPKLKAPSPLTDPRTDG